MLILLISEGALLHDTVEDCDCTFEELEKTFGKVVSRIVEECSDDTTQPSDVRKAAQISHAAHISNDASASSSHFGFLVANPLANSPANQRQLTEHVSEYQSHLSLSRCR